MSASPPRLRVFLSSPVRGMERVRDAIRERLGVEYEVRNSENWPARPVRPWSACRDEVLESDVLVLLLGRRYGSLCPDMAGMSFTEAEYRTAIEARNPQILAFDVTGLSDPDPETPEIQERLERLRREVRDRHTAPSVDEGGIARRVHESVADLVRREGTRGGPLGPFQRWGVRYRGDLEGKGVFHHRHELVGRDEVVEAVLAFFRSQGEVGILVGAAGMGKSRLLIEVAQRHGKAALPRLRFLTASAAPVRPEDLFTLPGDATVVVIDDAHTRGSLANDIDVLLARKSPPMRLLLAMRPEGMAFVSGALRSLEPICLPELSDLKNEGRRLAESILGGRSEDEAQILAAHSGGNPLFITVGAEMLMQGDLSLTDVVSEGDFRSKVFERILAGPSGSPPKSEEEQSVLKLIAAMGPVDADGSEVVRLAELGGLTQAACAKGLTSAIESGVVRNRGFQLAIVPDLLGDYVLRRACVTSKGYSTGFLVTLRVDGADARLLSNVVRNALIAQYLERREGRSVDLLSPLWGKLGEALACAGDSAARAAVDRLLPVAHLAPREVLEIARGVVARASTGDAESWERRQLRDSLTKLLGECSQDGNVSAEAAAILFRLAAREPYHERRASGPASQTLETIASYGWPPAYKRQLGVISAAMAAFRGGEVRSALVPAILGKALDREGEWTTADGRAITIHSYAVPVERTLAVRRAALDGLREIAMSRVPVAAAGAIHGISLLLSFQPGKLGRGPAPGEREGWQADAGDAAEQLVRISLEASLPVARSLARRRLQEGRRRGLALASIGRDRRLAAGEFSLEARIVDALFAPIDEGLGDEHPWVKAEKRHRRSCRWLAREIVRRCVDARAVVDLIHPLGEEVRDCELSHETHQGATHLVLGIMEVRPDWIESLHEAICEHGGFVASALWQIYALLFSQGRKRTARECCARALASTRGEVRAHAANALRFFCSVEPVEPADVGLVESVLAASDRNARRIAIWSLGVLAEHDLDSAKRLLLDVDPVGEDAILDALFAEIGDRFIPFGQLTASEVAALLDRIPRVTALNPGPQTLHVATFLKETASAHTGAFVRWVLSRLPPDDAPPAGMVLALEDLRRWIDPEDMEVGERRRMAQAILDHARAVGYGGLSRSVGVLLAWVCPSAATAVAMAGPWLDSADQEGFRTLISVLEDYGVDLVFGAPTSVEELLRHAARLGGRSSDRLRSMLERSVNPGVVDVGRVPVPEYARVADRAEALSQSQPEGSELQSLYLGIASTCRRWSRERRDAE